MKFYEGGVFHIFNQGNNKRPIFFTAENYGYFQWKMRMYLLPFGDLISWCLMPNHFHWQMVIRQIELPKKEFKEYICEMENKRRISMYGDRAKLKEQIQNGKNSDEMVSINQSIGILQMSYTKALNRQLGLSGSVFRKRCKAKSCWHPSLSFNKVHSDKSENYVSVCSNYIHQNPVLANLVASPIEYPWSSAKDYHFNVEDSMCNLELGRMLTKIHYVDSDIMGDVLKTGDVLINKKTG